MKHFSFYVFHCNRCGQSGSIKRRQCHGNGIGRSSSGSHIRRGGCGRHSCFRFFPTISTHVIHIGRYFFFGSFWGQCFNSLGCQFEPQFNGQFDIVLLLFQCRQRLTTFFPSCCHKAHAFCQQFFLIYFGHKRW